MARPCAICGLRRIRERQRPSARLEISPLGHRCTQPRYAVRPVHRGPDRRDLAPGSTTDHRVATGFYRNTLKNREGGVKVEEFRFEEVVDRTNTVATVWLGLSMECARCHDHKFDPITHRDYYRMFAFFNELDEVDIDAPYARRSRPLPERKAWV